MQHILWRVGSDRPLRELDGVVDMDDVVRCGVILYVGFDHGEGLAGMRHDFRECTGVLGCCVIFGVWEILNFSFDLFSHFAGVGDIPWDTFPRLGWLVGWLEIVPSTEFAVFVWGEFALDRDKSIARSNVVPVQWV